MLSIVILAAGQGKRMRSDLPKVLHPLAGRPLLEHVHAAAARLPHRAIAIVYGHGGRRVPDALGHLEVEWIEQETQLGTGHAVKLALPAIPDEDRVLVLYGDIPLVTTATLQRLVQAAEDTGFSLMTCRVDDPSGYGRILRDERGDIRRIVEEKDATERERAVNEINTGLMAVSAGRLRDWLAVLGNDNAQGEYYLTDAVALAVASGVAVRGVAAGDEREIRGINDRVQLAEVERTYQLAQARRLMREGLTLIDPARFDLRGELVAGRDVVIDVNVVLEGRVVLGDNVRIGPHCCLRDAEVAGGAVIGAHSVIEEAIIGRDCRIGPFARIRPQTRLAESVHIGNFVELKKAAVGAGSKINHLSYVGDSVIGRNVNVGAGTITCNFDGSRKHTTTVEDDVFIGSDTQLVAPVTVGRGATIGAGTTVTRDVAPDTLTYNRVERRTVEGWKKPEK